MKEKHLKIYAGIFIVLLILFFITKPRHSSLNLDEFVQNILIGISREDVRAVEIYKETGSQDRPQLVLNKISEEKWVIPSFFSAKARKTQVDRLLQDLFEMTGKVRSSDPKHLETYEITDEQGLHLLLKTEGDKVLANLIFGKKSEDMNSGFVRFAGAEKVYFVDKNILSTLGIYGDIDTLSSFKPTSLVDLNAVEEKQEDLDLVGMVVNGKEMVIRKVEKEVEVIKADSSRAMEKKPEWVLVEGKKETALDQKEAENFLRDITKIYAESVIDRFGNTFADMQKESQYGFSRASHILVFRKPDGPQQNVIFGKEYEKDKGYFMLVQYDNLIYKVTKYNFDKVFKWMKDLPLKKMKT